MRLSGEYQPGLEVQGAYQLYRDGWVRAVGNEVALLGHQQRTAVVTDPEVSLDLDRRPLWTLTAARTPATAPRSRFALLLLLWLLLFVLVHSLSSCRRDGCDG